jgi:hypothetical protein
MKSQTSLMNSKDSTFSEKDSATMSTEGTTKKSKNGSSQHGNSDTKQEGEVELIDGAFSVRKQQWGTYVSFDTDGTELITSLTEESCKAATRWWLKSRQDGFDDNLPTYSGQVMGKL